MFIAIYSQSDGHIGSINCGDVSTAEACRILNGIVSKQCRLMAFCSSISELEGIVQSFGLVEVSKVNMSEADKEVWNEFRDQLVKSYQIL